MSSEIESVNTAELMERVEMEQAEMEQVEIEPGLEPELDPELDLSDNDTSDLLDEKLVIMEDSGFVFGTNLSYFFSFIFISHSINDQK